MGRILWAILAMILFFAFAGVISTGIHNLRTEEETQNFTSVVTGGGETSANVTLTTDPFLDKASEVSITSSLGAGVETPVAVSYATATNDLLVGDLAASQTRTLYVVYYMERDDQYLSIIGPFLPFLVFGGILFAIGFGMWKRH